MKKISLSIIIISFVEIVVFPSCKKDSFCSRCRDDNKPPIANAGPDQVITLPTDSVLLDGSASKDPDGTIAKWRWRHISGPPFIAVNTSTAKAMVKNLSLGPNLFELKVTDEDGSSSRDTVNIAVIAAADGGTCNGEPDWEIVLSLPIDSAFIDDYFRDSEGICVRYVCGPNVSISGPWVKNLSPGVYNFRRYWYGCVQPAELIKITVIDDPNERNTITYKNMLWEYNWGTNLSDPNPHLYLTKPHWPSPANPAMEVYLQMDSLNNGEWFRLPSNADGFSFSFECQLTGYYCLDNFIVRANPENSNWDGKRANLKIKIQ